MSQYRYILVSLLFASISFAQAQPIVKINPGASECDVTPGDPIFQLDTTGNVIITGTLSGTGCGGGGTGGTPTFGFNPPAAGVKINGGSASVAAGSVPTVPFTYQAYNAPTCTVGQPTTTGTCPAINTAGGSDGHGGCTGTGAQLGCSPSAATLSIPTVASMGSNTNCNYNVTASCSGVPSSATLTVTTTAQGGGNFGTQPAACTASPVNTLGLTWQRSAMWTWTAGTAHTLVSDATDYRNIYSGPAGTGQLPWPSGSSGVKPVVDIAANQYLALGFVVPAGTSISIAPQYFNVGSASPLVAMTISECPGDFGQAGTHITSASCKSDRNGGGLQTYLGTAAGTCHLTPGNTYYLNMIDSSLPVANGTTAPATACQGGTCSAQVQMTY